MNAVPDDTQLFDHPAVRELVRLAVEEDLGDEGDITSRVVPGDSQCRAAFVFRQGGTVCGFPLAERVLARIAPEARLEVELAEGVRAEPGQTAATVTGPARGVLAAERLMLNFVQRLSGVATATRAFVDAAAGTQARVLDTRKTLPGWRSLAKYAVRTGGGVNHRFGLYDMVLIKDNHLAVWGGEEAIPQVLAEARRTAPSGVRVEVEVTSLDRALDAARAGADIVLLDNFDPPGLAEIVTRVHEDARTRGVAPPLLEASGGVTLESVAAIAATGVDRISTGWVTHSAPAVDVALDFLQLDARA